MNGKSDSASLALATVAILGQPPRLRYGGVRATEVILLCGDGLLVIFTCVDRYGAGL
jgi:hypothetical protein